MDQQVQDDEMKKYKLIQWIWFFFTFVCWSMGIGIMLTDTMTLLSNFLFSAGIGCFMFGALE